MVFFLTVFNFFTINLYWFLSVSFIIMREKNMCICFVLFFFYSFNCNCKFSSFNFFICMNNDDE